MCWALLFIQCQTQHCHHLCTNSVSTMQSLSRYASNHLIVIDISNQVFHRHKAGKSVVFCWLPDCTSLQLLKQSLCMDPWHLIELLAVIFLPLSIALFYPNDKVNGPIHKATNCEWWNRLCWCGVPWPVSSGRHVDTLPDWSHVPNTWPFVVKWASICLY